MPSSRLKTRYAADRDGLVCLLLDVRGNAREFSIQVYSPGKKRVVNLPRKAVQVETPDNKRWTAISVPRWLANTEGLYGNPDLHPVPTGFCLAKTGDTRTDQQKQDDAERSMAQWVVDHKNKYKRLPGQRWNSHKADRRNGNIFS
jgi:hypothetical protein